MIILLKLLECSFTLRTPAAYDAQCDILENSRNSKDSVNFGINCCSELNKIEGFHVINSQLPQDAMHVILEGVLPMEIKSLLFVYYERKIFTLDFLNKRMSNFHYGPEVKSKPPKQFSDSHITSESKLSLSGK